jgi:uncharacterized protein
MKTKKVRSGKAAKGAVPGVRRVTRKKATPAKAKRVKGKTSKPRTKAVRRKTTMAAKAKPVRKRVVRKPRKRIARATVERQELPLAPIASMAQEAEPAEQPAPLATHPELPPAKGTVPGELSLPIPAILLEGDEPPSPPMTGPGQKYVLGPTTPAAAFEREEAALPAAYGTGKLFLVARDPHWLYAHWDLTPEQQRQHNALSADHHLALRVHPAAITERSVREIHVHPESSHWFIHVDRPATHYVAELGYYSHGREWVTIATSPQTVTPTETASTDQSLQFATLPAPGLPAELEELAKQSISPDLPPAVAARERVLAELITRQPMQQDRPSVKEGEELLLRLIQESAATQGSLPTSFGAEAGSVSSPVAPAEERPAGFWLNLNAELIIYGGTDPGASVSIGGRPVPLRPDGTFSCRYSLPDGEHAVTVTAVSTQGEVRQAELQFSRQTLYHGEVDVAPQDSLLQPPAGEIP